MGVVAIEEIQGENDTVTLRTSMGEHPTDDIALLVHQYPFVSISFVDIARTVADTWRAHALPGDRAMKNLFERHGLVAQTIVVGKSL